MYIASRLHSINLNLVRSLGAFDININVIIVINTGSHSHLKEVNTKKLNTLTTLRQNAAGASLTTPRQIVGTSIHKCRFVLISQIFP